MWVGLWVCFSTPPTSLVAIVLSPRSSCTGLLLLGGAVGGCFLPVGQCLGGEESPTPIIYRDCHGANCSHFTQMGQVSARNRWLCTIIIGTRGWCCLSEFEKSRVSILPLIGP